MSSRIDRFWPASLALAAALFAVLGLIDPGADIVDLELAGTADRAATAMAGYDVDSARLQTAVDYVFMTLLAVGLAGALRRVWRESGRRSRFVSLAIVYLVCDALENVGIFVLLGDVAAPSGTVAAITTVFAGVKFFCLAAAVVAIVVGAVWQQRRND